MTRPAAICLMLLAAGCTPAPSEEPTPTGVAAAPPVAAPDVPSPAGFARTLTLKGITFRVSCPNQGSLNQLRIEPEGLAADNSPMVQEVEGTVTGAEVADLNADGSPEIYVYVQSAGSGSYGSLVAYSANNLKSLSGIYLPPIADDPRLSKGYMGHDLFAIAGDRLVQRFPIYTDADTNAQPTGGTRQVFYRLDAGEAGWVLRVEQAVT
jgi:Periplasmic lysozyme inhibitor of I-type lysozyme